MKITKLTEELSNMGKSNKEMQRLISIAEADALWKALVSRYDALNITNILLMLVKDEDLIMIIKEGIQILNKEVSILEKHMKNFNIPMPNKPPEQANIALDINAITDMTIYRDVYNGMAATLQLHTLNFAVSKSSTLRESFRKLLIIEMDLFDKYVEYGKQKGYMHEEPSFRS